MNTVLRVVTAIASIAAGAIHWDIWANHGYRSAPVRELILASAVLAVALGLLAFLNRRWAALPAAVANALFLAAFAVSRTAELPTLHGPWKEMGLAPEGAELLGIPTTLLLLVAEGVAVVCGLASLLFGRARRTAPLPGEFARA